MAERGRGGVWLPPENDDVIYEQPLTAHEREKDDKKISRREGCKRRDERRAGKEREGMGRARGKDQSWTLCEHRGGEEAEDVLSRIIPKFGGSGIPDAAAAVSTSSGWGCRQKGDLSFTWRLRPLGMRAQVRGRLSGFKFGVFRGPILPLPPVCCLLWSLLDVLAFVKSDSRGGNIVWQVS